MQTFHFNYRRRDYYIDAEDRRTAYGLMLKEAAARAAANKKAKTKALAKTMTCQCCGRAIFAETGVIAHHGYERPGSGWQTASCYGARHVPFEVARDTLGLMLDHMRAQLARNEAYRACVDAETEPCRVDVPDKSKPKVWGRGYPDMMLDITRENYADFRKAHEGIVFQRGLWDFDIIKTRYVAGLDSQIRMLTAHIKEQQARYDGWKQTHEWKEGWVKLTGG